MAGEKASVGAREQKRGYALLGTKVECQELEKSALRQFGAFKISKFFREKRTPTAGPQQPVFGTERL